MLQRYQTLGGQDVQYDMQDIRQQTVRQPKICRGAAMRVLSVRNVQQALLVKMSSGAVIHVPEAALKNLTSSK
jgi:hypothetical protein